ncbi:MAG: hypothetical protein PVJ05_09955 [Candidatus Thorarchaeota archaeon]|jgi:hypothetical protein
MQIEIPIDFDKVLIDSGSVIIVILLVSLLIFASRIRDIYSDIGLGTRRALIAYSMTGIAMALATFFGIHESYRFLITGTGAFFLGAILIAEAWILFSTERAKQSTVVTTFLVIGVFANNFLEEFFGLPLYFMMIGLSILLVGSVYLALVLLRENPSTFSASMLVVLLLYMSTWVIAATDWTFNHPQYYILQVIPLIFAATVFASVRKPMRRTLATFILYFAITIGLPMLIDAVRAGSWVIFYFVAIEIFTALCLMAPLEYFLEQASETGARMPLYLGAVVTFVALLVSAHSLSWAIFINQRLVWNQYLIWVDVVLCTCAIIAFMLAAVSSFFGEWVQTFTREALIIFGTAAAFLTFPLTQPVTIANDYVWTTIGVIITIGTLMFVRLSIRIVRAGGVAAAGRLMTFIISALMIAIVSVFSDSIPPLPPNVPIGAIALLLFAGVIALLSSPPVTARLTRTVTQLEELEELAVEEDGSIKIEY